MTKLKLAIASPKGGSGKSIIATNICAWLAQANQDVMLLDADKQATAKNWVDRRNAGHHQRPRVHVAQATTGDVLQPANDYIRRYDQVVIDTSAGQPDSPVLRSAIAAADVVLVPIRAAIGDLETARAMNDLIAMARSFNPKLIAYVFVTAAPTNCYLKRDAIAAREYLKVFDQLITFPRGTSDRQVYRDALLDGLGVVELQNSTARAEIQLLCQTIYQL